MNQQNFQDMMYASEERMKSYSKFSGYDDIGILSVFSNQINFTGKKYNIKLTSSNIKNITTGSQNLPVLNMLLGNIITLPLFIFMGIITSINFTIISLVIINIALIIFWTTAEWLSLELLSNDGSIIKLYLRPKNMKEKKIFFNVIKNWVSSKN